MINSIQTTIVKFKKYGKTITGFVVSSGIGAVMAAFLLNHYWRHNHPPIPDIVSSKQSGVPPMEIAFSAKNSFDPDGDPLKFRWLLNGKIVSELDRFTTTFDKVGTYDITLSVTDDRNMESSKTIFINLLPPKKAHSIREALSFFRYKIGWDAPNRKEVKYRKIDEVNFTGTDSVVLRYQHAGISESNLVILNHGKKMFGIWKNAQNLGEMSLIFNDDYSEATGWWSYDSDPKKYNMKLTRFTS